MEILSLELLGNPLLQWATATGAALLAIVALLILSRFVRTRLTTFAQKTDGTLDDALAAAMRATHFWFIAAVALLCGAQFLHLPEQVNSIVGHVFTLALILQAGLWAHAAISGLLSGYLARHRHLDANGVTTTSILCFIAQVALWSLVVLMLLDNLGFDVTTLVASLGIGGVAVALAAQNILGDMFASIAIALDQPVVIGDFIVVGDLTGTVERVGLKTTHLRSLSGETIVLSNSDLLNSRIRNYKRMSERRVLFGFGVTYDTPPDKLRNIPVVVKKIIEPDPLTHFDRAHLAKFGASALEFEVVYYVKSPDYGQFMDIQQRINLELIDAFQESGIEFAFPTQTIHLATPADAMP
ncbi:MAG: mechanosensitive ion channel family protein [Chromatiales bacterium]|nr:mechanosensitive ion channel family protein [Chromatiales bacterium]